MTKQPTQGTPEEIQEDRIASAYCHALASVQEAQKVLLNGQPHGLTARAVLQKAADNLNRYLAVAEEA